MFEQESDLQIANRAWNATQQVANNDAVWKARQKFLQDDPSRTKRRDLIEAYYFETLPDPSLDPFTNELRILEAADAKAKATLKRLDAPDLLDNVNVQAGLSLDKNGVLVEKTLDGPEPEKPQKTEAESIGETYMSIVEGYRGSIRRHRSSGLPVGD